MPSGTDWCFTINNPSIDVGLSLIQDEVRFAVWQLERGASGGFATDGPLAAAIASRCLSCASHWPGRCDVRSSDEASLLALCTDNCL